MMECLTIDRCIDICNSSTLGDRPIFLNILSLIMIIFIAIMLFMAGYKTARCIIKQKI
jgi:hypothetical protein